MMKNPFYKKTKMAGKTTEKTAAFKKAIKVLNHVPVDYAYTAEYSRYITNAEEEFRKKIKKIQVDDLCDDMFDAEIDAATDAMKASAAEQYTHHMNIILHNKGILDGEFHRLESEQELVKAKCSEAEAEIQTLKRMRKTPVSESGAKGSGITSCAVLVFVLIDLFIAKTPWNHVQSDGTLMACLCALAIAIALDAPMALAGKALREHEQGFRSKRSRDLVVVASVAGFLIAFAFNMGFSIFTRSLSFSMDFGGEAEKETAIMFSAVFKAVIPLLTSISSFVIS
ncbi:MAG: hypothetical protein IJ374_06435, partial [Lachnospiraceae bacterium]|nr:hypothetical protein [Lachnospiraceae bacterium]